MKIRTIHIHTDKKFLHTTQMFEGSHFDNTTILITKERAPIYGEDTLVFNAYGKGYNDVIALCNRADLVILYGLTPIKCRIAVSIVKEVKVFWRFFGYELYKRRPDLFKSELSRQYDNSTFTFKELLKKEVVSIYSFVKLGSSGEALFNRAVKRCDVFLALSEEEYFFLKKLWPNLPGLIKLPHYHLNRRSEELNLEIKYKEKRPIIIIGNNRSSYNNHLDVIKTIEKYKTKINYNFTLLFNYGTESNYSKLVLNEVANKSYFNALCDFIPKEEFLEFYQKPSALVINGYRQMAGANIRMALENGTKVYMSNKNVHKQFLERQGFKIFSMEDFEEDLKDDSLYPDEEMAKHNFDMFQKFCDSYTKDDFQLEIIKFLNPN